MRSAFSCALVCSQAAGLRPAPAQRATPGKRLTKISQHFCPSEQLRVDKCRLIGSLLPSSRCPSVLHSHPRLASRLLFKAILPFNLTPSSSCSIIRHLPRPHDRLQVQQWERAGRDAQRQRCYRRGCDSKIAPESEVLSVSVKRGAAKWLQPSISAPSEGCEMLLRDS